MIIEKTIRNYLDGELDCPVWMEIPKGMTIPSEYVLIQKTGSRRYNHLNYAVVTLQSYSDTLKGAMELNESVKDAMDGLVILPQISRSALNSDYNFTDTQAKVYRYQAVYDITHY